MLYISSKTFSQTSHLEVCAVAVLHVGIVIICSHCTCCISRKTLHSIILIINELCKTPKISSKVSAVVHQKFSSVNKDTCKHWNLQYIITHSLIGSVLNQALFFSYGVICSSWWLLSASGVQHRTNLPQQTAYQHALFNLYNKSDGNQSKIQRIRLPKLHSLSYLLHHTMDHV